MDNTNEYNLKPETKEFLVIERYLKNQTIYQIERATKIPSAQCQRIIDAFKIKVFSFL